MITGTIFCLPPKMSPHWRATVNFDQPDEHGHDCCFCTQDEMVRDPSNSEVSHPNKCPEHIKTTDQVLTAFKTAALANLIPSPRSA
jgi:hypothetical protein